MQELHDLDLLLRSHTPILVIEQVVVSALYAARAQDQTLDDRHLLEELERTQPLSVVMAERIHYLRDWAQERTVPAG